MSDKHLRELRRRAIESGDPEDVLQYRLARIRAGLEEIPTVSYQVLELHLKSLRKKIASYAKRAHRTGQIPLALHVGERTWVERQTPDGRTARLAVFAVAVLGDAPTTDEWEFIAALHHTPSGTIIQRAFGTTQESFPEKDLEIYRERDSQCDDCELRRKRNDTYVLRNRSDKRVMQVGRSCLAAFLSCSPEAALYQFRTEKALTDLLVRGNDLDDAARPEWGAPLFSFLVHLNATQRSMGRRAVWAVALHQALRLGIPSEKQNSDLHDQFAQAVHADDILLAEKQLDAARADLSPSDKTLSQDLHNLAVIVDEDTVANRHAKIAATLVSWYADRVNAEVTESREAARAHLRTPLGRRIALVDVLVRAGFECVGEGNSVVIDADELIKLVLANGEINPARNEIREFTGPVLTKSTGDYLGVIGETVTVGLRVTTVRYYNDRHSGDAKAAVNMTDADGRNVVWFANRSEAEAPRITAGTVVVVSGRVDGCRVSSYSGNPETTLTGVEILTSVN